MRVLRSWNGVNEKWVVGELDNDTLESRYTLCDSPTERTGHTLYKGLSLQHV